MKLFLIRHAEAVDLPEDAKRYLSERGKDQVAGLVRFFKANGKLGVPTIWHSPLVRALETAKLLNKGLGLDGALVEVSGLEPEADPRLIAKRLKDAGDELAIVGHEPHLGALAALLVCGRPSLPVVTFKKASCLALDGFGDTWSIRWLISPGLLQ